MLDLFLLAAVQVQTLKLPPALPAPAPAPVIGPAQSDPGRVSVQLFPDLVIKEVRTDGDSTIHFRVANEGTADAKTFVHVRAYVYIDSRKHDVDERHMAGIPMGESRWVPASSFNYDFKLSKVTAVTATVDPPIFNAGFLGGGDPSRELDRITGTSPFKCFSERGCILETDEKNNDFKAEGAAIGRGKPD